MYTNLSNNKLIYCENELSEIKDRISFLINYDISKTQKENINFLFEQQKNSTKNLYTNKYQEAPSSSTQVMVNKPGGKKGEANPYNIETMGGGKQVVNDFDFEDFMEGVREQTFSLGWVAGEAFVSAFQVSRPAIQSMYASFLLYDLYLIYKGKPNYLYLVIDTLVCLSMGTLKPILAPLIKYGKQAFTTLIQVAKLLKTTNVASKLNTFLKGLSQMLSKISEFLKPGLEWLKKKFPNLPIVKTILSSISNLTKILVNKLMEFVKLLQNILSKSGEVATSLSQKAGASERVAQNVGQGTKNVITNTSMFYGIPPIISNVVIPMILWWKHNFPSEDYKKQIMSYAQAFGWGNEGDTKKLFDAVKDGWRPGNPVPEKYQTNLFKQQKKTEEENLKKLEQLLSSGDNHIKENPEIEKTITF